MLTNNSLFSRQIRAFTIVELIVCIAIILILLTIATISLQRVLDNSRNTKNASNLRQLWAAVLLYSNDNGGRLPSSVNGGPGSWHHQLVRWHEDLSITETTELFSRYDPPSGLQPTGFLELFNTPLNPTQGNMAFGSGGWVFERNTSEVFGRLLASIDDPASSVALAPHYNDEKLLSGRHWRRPSGLDRFSFDEDGYVTCAFVDGSVRTISRQSLEEGRYVYVYPNFEVPD